MSTRPVARHVSAARPAPVLAVALALVAGACAGGATGEARRIEAISVTPATATIASGDSQLFGATARYSDGTTAPLGSGVSWSSADPAVATIDGGGVAKGIAATTRQTVITAAQGGVTGTATLTVTPAVVRAITIDPATPPLGAGLSAQLRATARLSDGSTTDVTASTTFASSRPATALVSPGGLLLAVAPGVATITATHAPTGIAGTAAVTVSDARLDAVTVEPDPALVPRGFERALTAVGHFSDGSAAPLAGAVTWSTSDANVASVSPSGVVRGVALGSATVTARPDGSALSGVARVDVTDATLAWVSLYPSGGFVFAGYDLPVVAVGHFSDGSSVPLGSGITWTTSDPAVAFVLDASVVGVTAGEAMIGAAHDASGFSAAERFRVSPTHDVSYASGLPAAGTVDRSQALYRIGGVTPGAWYRVALTNLADDVDLYVSADAGLRDVRCASTNVDLAPETCLVQATSTSLLVVATGWDTLAGSEFTLDVAPAVPPSQDALPYPAGVPYAGTLTAERSLAVTGLSPGTYVLVTLGGLAADADLSVYTDALLTRSACSSRLPGTSPDVCAVVVPEDGTVRTSVEPWDGATTPFTLDVQPIAPPLPLLASALPAAIHAEGYQVYAVDGLVPGVPYDVTLDAATGDVDLRVFGDVALADLLCDATTAGPGAESCVAVPPGTRLYVAVDATPAPSGADLALHVTRRAPPALDGTLVYGVDLPAAGAVSTASLRYRVTGLVPGALYGVSLSGLAADVDLTVYDAAQMSHAACTSDESGTASEACVVTASAAGELFIELLPFATTGTAFSLQVLPAMPPVAVVADAAADLPYAGFASGGRTATVRVTGLVPGDGWLVALDGITDDLDLAVYADAALSQRLCDSWTGGPGEREACFAVANGAGDLYVVVDGTHALSGSPFVLTLSAPPVVSLASLPASRSVSPPRSMFVVDGLTGAETYRIQLAANSADVALWVYADAARTQELCSSSFVDPYEERCAFAAPPGGRVYVYVYSGASPATFDVHVEPYALPALSATLSAFPHAGDVGVEVRYYRVTGLTPWATYTFRLGAMSDDADLWVYFDPGFTQLVGISQNDGTLDDSADAFANAAGEAYVAVDGRYSAAGTPFTLDVTPLP